MVISNKPCSVKRDIRRTTDLNLWIADEEDGIVCEAVCERDDCGCDDPFFAPHILKIYEEDQEIVLIVDGRETTLEKYPIILMRLKEELKSEKAIGKLNGKSILKI